MVAQMCFCWYKEESSTGQGGGGANSLESFLHCALAYSLELMWNDCISSLLPGCVCAVGEQLMEK